MVLSRATLPSEFFDITSAQMLVAPEPQYPHAILGKMALNVSMQDAGALGLAGREIPQSGAPVAALEAQRLALADPLMGEAIVAVAELANKGVGHVVRLNRLAFTDSTYTEAARRVAEGASISTTPIDITAEQVSVTLQRFAGPYGASSVQPYAVDAMAAQKSVHNLSALVGRHLRRDFDKWLDAVLVAAFDAGSNSVFPTGISATTSFAVAGDGPLTASQLFETQKVLDVANVPLFANGRRACVLHPQQIRQLQDDPQFARYAEFHRDINPLLQPSYVKSLGGLDIYKSNTLNTTTNGGSVTVYKGQAFGPGMVGMGVGQLPMVRSSTDDNYGLQAKVIWECLAGFQTLDNRFGATIYTD